jgi:hypothetical protein
MPLYIGYPQNHRQYKEMILDATETVLGFLGFDTTVYSNNIKNKGGKKKMV